VTDSGSFRAGLDNVISATASFATTGSNIFRGDQTITGSILANGSNTFIGSSSFYGQTFISGGLIISASQNQTPATLQIYGDVRQKGGHVFLPVDLNIDPSISGSYIFSSGSTNDLYFGQSTNGNLNITRLRWLEGNLYTGLLSGGLITAATGSTVFNVSSGSGMIVTLNASLSDDPYPTIKYVKWDNITNIPITNITSSIQSFIGIDGTGSVVQQTNAFNNGQYNTVITIGTVLHQNKATVNASITYPNVAYGYKQRTYDFVKAFGPLKLSGLTINTSGSLGLTVGSGTAFADGRNYQVDPNNPSYIIDPGTPVSKIFRYYQSGSEFIQDTNNGAGYNNIDPVNYNNSGSLTPVPGTGANRQFSIQRVFWYPNSATKGIVVYYGNRTYPTLTDAVANIPYEAFEEVENTKQNAVYLGAVVVRNNAAFTDTTSYSVSPGGIFRQVGGSGGGGTAPTARLVDLSDVSITAPSDYQPLVYNTSLLKWVNGTGISASLHGNADTATSASYAYSASQAISSSYALSSSYSVSSSYALSSSYAASASVANSSSYSLSSSYAATASYWSGSIDSASYAFNATSASYASVATTSTTASYADNFIVDGTLTARTIIVQTITSSVDFITGSTRFGSTIDNTHQFTGSVSISGSLAVNDSAVITTSQTSSMVVLSSSYANDATSASYALSASYAPGSDTSVSASYALSASYSLSSSYALSASHADTASYWSGSIETASYASSASVAISSSYADSASYWSGSIESASYANSASYALSASYWSGSIESSSYALTASYWSGSIETASYAFSASVAISSSYAATASYALNVPVTAAYADNANSASYALTASYWSGSIESASHADIADTASFAFQALSASVAEIAISSSYALTASYAMNAGGTGVSAIYIADQNVLQGTASYFNFTGSGVTATINDGTASISITGGGSGTAVQGASVQYTQPTLAATWSINHAINSRTPVVEVYDSNYSVIIPTAIQNPGPYQTIIYFDVPQSGFAIISTGGVLSVTGSNAILNQTVASSTWSFSHDLNSQYPVFTIFDNNNDVIIPQRIHAVDTGSAVIYFSTPRTGTAVASVAGAQDFVTSASYAATASYWSGSIENALSSSYAATASYWSGSINNALSSSFATTASRAINANAAVSASYALSASHLIGFVPTFPYTGAAQILGSLGITGSSSIRDGALTILAPTTFVDLEYADDYFDIGTGLTMVGNAIITGSLTATSLSGSLLGTASNAVSSSFATTSSYAVSSSYSVTSSYALSASVATSASYALNATSASYAVSASTAISSSFARSASYAATSSFANAFTVAGTLTAQTLVVQTVTSSVVYSSGSNIFGNSVSNTHQFTGSVTVTGSLSVLGSAVVTSNQTASMSVLTASYAISSSQAASASIATTSSYAVIATTAATASHANTFSLGGSLMDYGSIFSSLVGTNNFFTRSTGSYTAAFYNYFVQNGTNARSGQVMAVWNTGSVAFTDVSTTDIGNTSAVTASVAIVSGEVQFNLITNTSGWGGKSTVTYM
jgi:hypothetical protein